MPRANPLGCHASTPVLSSLCHETGALLFYSVWTGRKFVPKNIQETNEDHPPQLPAEPMFKVKHAYFCVS